MLADSYYLIKGKVRIRLAKRIGSERYSEIIKRYEGRRLLDADEANQYIYEGLQGTKPFMACRFGSVELFSTGTFHFGRGRDYEPAMDKLTFYAGFFPQDCSLGKRFSETMINACGQTDLLAVWFFPYEDFLVKEFLPKQSQISYLMNIEPWKSSVPWTRALKGKKVLVIHPFEKSIRQQYDRRQVLFKDPMILPDFTLITLKAVQTVAGEKDDRFLTWFDALQYMFDEAMKIDFDIAIIGCGAYGMPLAAKLKQAGKKAVHLGGITQILFGIKGNRWETQPAYQYVRNLMNQNWVYPLEEEKPAAAQKIENGCYW